MSLPERSEAQPSPQGRVWMRATARYLGGGKDGKTVRLTWEDAMKRAVELGAGSPARALEMLAQEFLGTYGGPAE